MQTADLTDDLFPNFDTEGYTKVGTPVAVAPVVDPQTKLMLSRFESMGGDCEFGLVQRRFQAEPLGLLRWANPPIDVVTDMLNMDFSGFGGEDRTFLKVASWGELVIYDPKYKLTSHTFIHENGVNKEKFLQKQRAMRQFLVKNFLGKLESARKVLVYKSNEILELDKINQLYHALLRHNKNNRLLFVQPPHEGDNSCNVLFDQLYSAQLTGLGPQAVPGGRLWKISFDAWVSLCAETEQLFATLESPSCEQVHRT